MQRKIMVFGFSLVEMLMALLVASLLLVAMAPVITKHTNEGSINILTSSGANAMPSCAYVNNTAADMVIDNDCIVPEDKYLMSAIIVSGGGGGGGAAGQVKEENGRKIEINGVRTEIFGISGAARNQAGGTSKIYDIDSTMSDIEVEIVSGGSGGADPGVQGGYPSSQSDCGNWGYYLDYTKNAKKYPNGTIQHSICVATRNPGDAATAPPRNVTGVTSVSIGATCSASSSGNCCWYGNTGKDGVCNSTSGSYSGCTRTICQWSASKAICAAWKPSTVASKNGSSGRLPTLGELDAISRQVKFAKTIQSGQSLLQFCGINTYVDSNPITNCTQIDTATTFFPYRYWGDDGESASNTHSYSFISDYHYYLYGSNALTDKDSYRQYSSVVVGDGYQGSNALSARCVIDNVQKFEAYHGGGGSAGMYAKQKIPNEVLQKAFTNNDGTQYTGTLKLRLYAGHGGDWHSNENKNSTRSAGSFAELTKEDKVIWKILVPNSHSGVQPNPALAGTGTWNSARPGDNWPSAFSATDMTNNYCMNYNAYSNDKRHNVYEYIPCGLAEFDLIKGGRDGHGSSKVYPSDTENAGFGGSAYWRTAAQALSGAEGQYSEDTGLENDGISGKNAASETSPGAGGAGGFCIQGPTKDSPKCGKGGNGAGGAARFTYRKTYPGAGGGGGGAGKLAHIRNIPVIPGNNIKIQAGAQGSGGQAGGNGISGGNSYVELPNGTRYEVTGGSGGQAGSPAIVLASSIIQAKGGAGGVGGTLNNELKPGDAHYPNTVADNNLAKGKTPEASTSTHLSPGGNGGINVKISILAGLQGIPCGAYSTTAITINNKNYQCGSKDLPTKTYDPVPLTRALNAIDIKSNISNYINTYAAGATGGGGGGWSINSFNGTENIGKGANGMGGYVILYFQ